MKTCIKAHRLAASGCHFVIRQLQRMLIYLFTFFKALKPTYATQWPYYSDSAPKPKLRIFDILPQSYHFLYKLGFESLYCNPSKMLIFLIFPTDGVQQNSRVKLVEKGLIPLG